MTLIDILNEYHITPQFPPGAVKQAERMPQTVFKADLEGRKDLTDKLIITIDGDDAKDFDDAVSIEMLDDGKYLLGVHIADVSHYVTHNSPIDRAAFLRGTSVYLIDTVIPMLPFELSNELCSLKPNEVRLTLSVFMTITPRGRVESYEICKSFIKSHDRMTYNNVTKILEGDKELCERYSHLTEMLGHMKKLASVLKRKRISRGAIEFVSHESKITLDKDGKPIHVERYPITLSNNIIEEFMLICNETVAKHMQKKSLPCVYRVHEKPDLTRIERLGEILPVLGVDFEYSTDMTPKDFQKVLNTAVGMECFDAVNYLVLRTMTKAKYSEKNLGHFGLAATDYCHFTSPIRRYPDLVVHRILKAELEGGDSGNYKELAVSASLTSSVCEINAADAEIAWKSVKKAEYMTDKLGEEYDGHITHVTSSGFFVELDNTVEGFVPARTIEDDVYILADNGVSLIGLNTKKLFTVGNPVKIRVAAVEQEGSRIDFELVSGAVVKKRMKKTHGHKITKTDRRVLKQLKSESREARRIKNEIFDKADSERKIYENAVTYMISEEIFKRHQFKKQEKRFVGVMIGDMAAMTVLPLYKDYLHERNEFSLKNCLVSAAHNVRAIIENVADGFEITDCGELTCFAVEFVCAALRHFDACMKYNDFDTVKREREYDSIAKKIRKKNKK